MHPKMSATRILEHLESRNWYCGDSECATRDIFANDVEAALKRLASYEDAEPLDGLSALTKFYTQKLKEELDQAGRAAPCSS